MHVKRFPLGALWTNCYLIWDENNDGFVVDPGGPAEAVEDFIRTNDIRIHWIVLTHGHSDHLGGIAQLRNLSENGIAIHTDDAECLTNPERNLSAYSDNPIELASAERLLNDGDKLKIGKMTLDVIHTPGHTPGGICIIVSEGDTKFLLSGDTLFARSIGRSDLPGGDELVLTDSLRKLTVFPDSLRVFPGHGPETTIGEERLYNPYWPM